MPSLRPHDVAVALQLALKPGLPYGALAEAVGLSRGEMHNVVKRLIAARLLQADQRKPNLNALLDFLVSGVPYAFAAEIGPSARGIPTAHSALPAEHESSGHEPVVWPSVAGHVRGASVAPLYRTAPETAAHNPELYELLALVDSIRIGRARERQRAKAMIHDRLMKAPHQAGHGQ